MSFYFSDTFVNFVLGMYLGQLLAFKGSGARSYLNVGGCGCLCFDGKTVEIWIPEKSRYRTYKTFRGAAWFLVKRNLAEAKARGRKPHQFSAKEYDRAVKK